MRRWELVADGSAKFWEVARDGVAVTVRFGRLGTAGQTKTKELASEEAARAHVAKLVAEKEKKGYQSVADTAATPISTAVVAAVAVPPAAPDPAPATAPTSASATTTVPASSTPPRDEDAWVMPEEWLRKAMPRRDVTPLPEFAVDPAQAQEFRDRIAEQGEKIAEVLAHPASKDDLVRALRDHLAGRPDPVGAAALAKVACTESSPVHWWIEEFGLPFAAVAAVHHPSVHVYDYQDGRTGEWSGNSLRWAPQRHYGDDVGRARALVEVRTALAVADQPTYDAAVAELEKFGGDAFSLAARAFLAPTRHDWFEEANAAQYAPFWMVLCAASTLEQLANLRVGPFIWSPVGTYTALHVHGPALAPLLDANLRSKIEMGADSRRLGLNALAALPTDEAFLLLLTRLRERYVRPALLSAMAAFPARAARLLALRADGDADVRNLLRLHLLSHPGLVLPEGVTPPVTVPDAPAGALPRVLAEPPWEHRRPQAKPVVLKDVQAPAAHLTWLPGEREEWAALTGWWSGYAGDWTAMTARGTTTYDHRLFASGPDELARPLLAGWVPGDTWGSEGWGRRIAARFEMDALPAMVRLAAMDPHVSGVVLLPYAAPEVAGLMADWFVRLKTARAFAVSWLARHREAAARLLLPAALGAAGPARRNAEFALRHLHLETGVDVVAVATSVSAEAAAAIRTLIDVDPLDVLPTKLPVVGDWADPGLLPQVLLADGSGALSVRAARNLLMTAALSKPDATYPGLPLAVEACDRASLAEFGWAVFGRWQDVEAPAKDGWALTALGWFGDDETVRRLAPLIRAWPGESQHARAVTGLDVLAQIGSEVALTHLNTIAERVKFKGLKARAQEKVSDIAAALGLSRDQLSDRLVPRLGLDDEATLVIDYGPRQFTVGFDEQLKPYVLDADGKRRKDLPKPGAKDDQELAPAEHKRFATLKKDVRGIATDQIHRLERAMVDQRTWSAEEFHAVLAAHPLLWHLVRRLVWITDTGLSFRLAEDRTLADSNDDEVTLPEDATVRVAHPVDLADTLPAWGEVFADYEILQPFPQLGRPVHAFTPGEDVVPQLQKYVERTMPVGRLLGLTKRGWERCQPQDNGTEPWMTRPLPSGGALVACVDPGITVGMVDMFPEMTFSSLWFSPHGTGAWSAPRDGGPATFDVDPVTASELLSELESLHA
ncbi:DUF4132 domain-containing protein [Lentzea sp.]|uniref:DUF4132 domain-containing protein n=1 Tax=Lentzea sp. TaxID=56099 RepID=UPI002C4EEE1F|nr:DUF4132 domain-containing protein [Lentzea sp.]HUQ56670.1 DUF4132 domain-containing protein [Lentzea sp.]